MTARSLYSVLLVLSGGIAQAQVRGPWDLTRLRVTPEVTWLQKSGPQRSLFFDNVPYHGRPTRVFAYYAVPDHLDGKAPAMLLIHGGGGRAFPEWTTLWAQRGYVAMAIDLGGAGPDGARHAAAGPDQDDAGKFFDIAHGVPDTWPYHAVAAIIRAISLLQAQPEADPNRIGVTGISWGGYLTSLVAGIDDRIRVAIPVYGCGFLHENSVWRPLFDKMPEDYRTEWVRNFDPSQYLSAAAMPMLWINGTNDFAYPLDSHLKSSRLPKGARVLRITVKMPHSHKDGWEPIEIALFADQVLRGGTPLATLAQPEQAGDGVSVKFRSATTIVGASLHYTHDAIAWTSRDWTSVPAIPQDGVIQAKLPNERPLAYFLTLTDIRGAIVSSEYRELLP